MYQHHTRIEYVHVQMEILYALEKEPQKLSKGMLEKLRELHKYYGNVAYIGPQ